MKKTFTKDYILKEKGCYTTEEVLALSFIDNKKITLKNLFDGLPIKDFSWFFVRKCELTLTQKRWFALHCAKQVLPIYEKKYPNDLRVRECVEATEKFLNGEITKDELLVFRKAAADTAVAAAYAAAAAAYTAAAAAYTAAADAYTAAADAAVAAAYAAAAYKQSIWNYIKTIK